MTVLMFSSLIGRIPILHKTRLPQNAAQVCLNAVADSKALAPMKTIGSSSFAIGTTRQKTLYYVPTYGWTAWSDIVDVVPAPVENTDYRFFYAGPSEGYPKISSKTLISSGATRRLGVLQPNYAASGAPLNFLPIGTGDGTEKYTVSYAYTCVDEFGGESVLSVATAPYDLQGNQCMKLTNFVINSLATYGNSILYFRLYRRVTTTSGAGDWFWVKARAGSTSGTAYWDLPVSIVSSSSYEVFDSDGAGTDLGEIGDNCESSDYDAPPADVIGLTEIQNGVMLAWSSKKVCPNVPFVYHAFPLAYRFDFSETIMGIGVFNETALVATSGQPYLIGGVSPANYVKKKLPYPWPCVSRRSVISSNIGVFYASIRGLVWWNGSSIQIITEKIISEAQWAAMVPTLMMGFFFKGKVYIIMYGTAMGFILDVSGEQPFIIDFTLPYSIYGGFTDKESDVLRLISYGDSFYDLRSFGEGSSNLTMQWQSREEVTPAINFSSLKIIGTGWGTATVKLYGDGLLKDTITATGNGVYRLSSGYRASRWSVEVSSSTVTVEAIAIGTSVREIANVG